MSQSATANPKWWESCQASIATGSVRPSSLPATPQETFISPLRPPLTQVTLRSALRPTPKCCRPEEVRSAGWLETRPADFLRHQCYLRLHHPALTSPNDSMTALSMVIHDHLLSLFCLSLSSSRRCNESTLRGLHFSFLMWDYFAFNVYLKTNIRTWYGCFGPLFAVCDDFVPFALLTNDDKKRRYVNDTFDANSMAQTWCYVNDTVNGVGQSIDQPASPISSKFLSRPTVGDIS